MPTGLRTATGWDPDTFTKTMARRDRAASEGERAAAETAMSALARRAGLTVEAAIARVAPPVPRNPFEELFNSPQFRAEAQARDEKRARAREAALSTYGSEAAVWAPTALETALTAACAPLITPQAVIGGNIETLQGWHGEGFKRLPEAVRAAILAVAPIDSVKAAWAEYQEHEALADVRQAFFRDYEHDVRLRARITILEHRLDSLPAATMNDVRARLDWLAHITVREWNRGPPEDSDLVARLRADVERMWERLRERPGPPPTETPR